MNLIRRATVLVLIVLAVLILFPFNIVLVPEMSVVVRYEGGQIAADADVSRTWNHYLGDGWTSSVLRTDVNGMVKFKEVSRRVSLLEKAVWNVLSIPGH